MRWQSYVCPGASLPPASVIRCHSIAGAVSLFQKRPKPPGTLLAWVCRDDTDYLDFAKDQLVLRPA